MTKVLVVSNDPLSDLMPGPAIRAWNLADVLSTHHEVKLASTVACSRIADSFECLLAEPGRRTRLERWAEVAVVGAGGLHDWPSLAGTNSALVVDAYDPYHLENLEGGAEEDSSQRYDRVRRMSTAINRHLTRGDYFLCATERQRDFWLGSLAAIGRVNPYVYDSDPTLAELLGVVPFGLPVARPERTGPGLKGTMKGIGADDKVVLWAGGVYNWFDPVTLIRAMPKVVQRVPTAKLVFLGMQHPNPAIPAMRAAVEARQTADELQLTDSVAFFKEGWVPYDNRANFLLDADVGVSTHLEHIETRFSFRTRVLDYLWASLPMVLTEGDVLAEELAGAGLARTAVAGDVDGLAQALVESLESDRPHEESFERVRERYHWPIVAAPLLQFCGSPRHAADRAAAKTLEEFQDPLGDRTSSYNHPVPSPKSTVNQLRERAIGGLIRTIAASTADEAVGEVSARIAEVERILGDQGDAADEVAEIIGRTLTRLSAEVTGLSSEIALLRERLEQLKSPT